METITYQGETIRKWTLGSSTFLAWPERGARLMNWHLTFADGTVRDVIYWPEDTDMAHPASIRGGNPILFPFVARSFDDGKENAWCTPDGQHLPMKRHGYARDGAFALEEIHENGFTAKFLPSEECQAA